jgi:hypothetical protein
MMSSNIFKYVKQNFYAYTYMDMYKHKYIERQRKQILKYCGQDTYCSLHLTIGQFFHRDTDNHISLDKIGTFRKTLDLKL